MTDIITYILIAVCLLFWGVIIVKLIRNKFSPVKTVEAKVCDKYKNKVISEYPENLKADRFVVVFETIEKKLSFIVSKFSYENYKINEKGILKYKGTKLISFK